VRDRSRLGVNVQWAALRRCAAVRQRAALMHLHLPRWLGRRGRRGERDTRLVRDTGGGCLWQRSRR
jgi:hypothetical protein